jgi:hypothetical protein
MEISGVSGSEHVMMATVFDRVRVPHARERPSRPAVRGAELRVEGESRLGA